MPTTRRQVAQESFNSLNSGFVYALWPPDGTWHIAKVLMTHKEKALVKYIDDDQERWLFYHQLNAKHENAVTYQYLDLHEQLNSLDATCPDQTEAVKIMGRIQKLEYLTTGIILRNEEVVKTIKRIQQHDNDEIQEKAKVLLKKLKAICVAGLKSEMATQSKVEPEEPSSSRSDMEVVDASEEEDDSIVDSDKEDNDSEVKSDKEEDDSEVKSDKKDNDSEVKSDKEEDDSEVKSDKEDDDSEVKSDKKEDDSEVKSDKEDNDSEVKSDKEEDDSEVKSDKKDNDSEVKSDKEEDDSEVKSDKKEDDSEVKSDKEEDDSEVKSDKKEDDSEVKSDKEEEDKCSVVPKSPKTGAKFSFVASLLTQEQKKKVQKLAATHGSKYSAFYNVKTTHVIMNADADLVCHRSLKYFQGLAARVWIVSYYWVEACLEVGYLLNEEGFEIQGDLYGRKQRGPEKARTWQGDPLLDGYELCLMGPYKDSKVPKRDLCPGGSYGEQFSKDELESILELCGSTVVPHPTLFSFETEFCYILCQSGHTQEHYDALSNKFKVPVVSREWLLCTIATYQIQSTNEYRLSVIREPEEPSSSRSDMEDVDASEEEDDSEVEPDNPLKLNPSRFKRIRIMGEDAKGENPEDEDGPSRFKRIRIMKEEGEDAKGEDPEDGDGPSRFKRIQIMKEEGGEDSEEDSEDEDDDSGVDESSIIRASDIKTIYVTKVLKSNTTKKGKKKKINRVYNSHHFCTFCKKFVNDFAQHILSKSHSHHQEVVDLKSKKAAQRKNMIARLRMVGDHENNTTTMNQEKGELILGRRLHEGEVFICKSYGPCPSCFEWMKISTLSRHKCIGKEDDNCSKLSKGQIETQSRVLAGYLKSSPTEAMLHEVFPSMRTDQIGIIAKNDQLIVAMGNKWMEKNVGNKLKRKTYTSCVMRLLSRLLLALRQIVTPPEGWDLVHYIKPCYFEAIVKATLVICQPDCDDESDMKAPSNGLKLSHYLKQVASIHLANSIKSGNMERKKEAKEFLQLIEIDWSTVTHRTLLEERKREKSSPLPLPADVKKLSEDLVKKAEKADLVTKDAQNFRQIALAAQALLITYNRRRPGEVQALRVSTYKDRKTGIDQVNEQVFELTELEKVLVHSQEVVEIRGKRGRTVPLVVPDKARPLMEFLADKETRREAGVSSNPYMFANQNGGVLRGDYAVRVAKEEANLQYPGRIQCTNLRKYMATLVQVMNLNDQQHRYVTDHLGHNLDVHRIFYRSTSDIIERLDLAKILMLLDNGKIGSYRGQSVEDIAMEDILDVSVEDEKIAETVAEQAMEEEYFPELPDCDDVETATCSGRGKHKKKDKKSRTYKERHTWTEGELKEIRSIFAASFAKNKTPGIKEVRKGQEKSKRKGGTLWKIKVANIKSKCSWLRLHSK